jgi:hypothetical protein
MSSTPNAAFRAHQVKSEVKQSLSTLVKENMQQCMLETAKNCLVSAGYEPTSFLISRDNLETELKRSSIVGWDSFHHHVWCGHVSAWTAPKKNPNLTVLTTLCMTAMGIAKSSMSALAPGVSTKFAKGSFRRHATRVFQDEKKRLKNLSGGAAAVSALVHGKSSCCCSCLTPVLHVCSHFLLLFTTCQRGKFGVSQMPHSSPDAIAAGALVIVKLDMSQFPVQFPVTDRALDVGIKSEQSPDVVCHANLVLNAFVNSCPRTHPGLSNNKSSLFLVLG